MTPRTFTERALLAAVLCANLAALLLAARNGYAPLQQPLTFGLVFWLWFLAAYTALALPVIGLTTLASRAAPWLPRAVLLAAGVLVLGVAIFANPRALRLLVALSPPERFRLLAPASFCLSALALAVVVAAPPAHATFPRLGSALAVGSLLGALWPPMGAAEAAAGPAIAPARIAVAPPAQRLLVVGLDGASWDLIDALIARGELPNLSALRARGASGPLGTIRPTLSPIIWTTVVTGRTPQAHGVTGFFKLRLAGVNDGYEPPRPVRGFGLPLLLAAQQKAGQVTSPGVTSDIRRVPAFWNVATRMGSPVNVVDWWATWPAEPVLGTIVSDRIFWRPWDGRGEPPAAAGVTFPADRHGPMARLVVRPEQVSFQQARPFVAGLTADEFAALPTSPDQEDIFAQLKFFLGHFETAHRTALEAMRSGARAYAMVPDTLVLYRLIDRASHVSLPDSELLPPERRRRRRDGERHRRVVTEAYRAADRALGELMEAFGEGNVVVLSDHGFGADPENGPHEYNHRLGPDGIFLAAGPAFQPARLSGLDIYDVLPTMLRVKGFPIAADLKGRAPEEALAPDFRARHPIRRVASFGARSAPGPELDKPEIEHEMRERLRALGYIE